MKGALSILGFAVVLAASGCGGGSKITNPGISARLTEVRSGLAALRAGGVIATLDNLASTVLTATGTPGNLQVSDPCDPSGAGIVYLVATRGAALHLDAFSDVQHTIKVGSADITSKPVSTGGGTCSITFNNFATCVNGQVNFTLDSTGANGALQFVHLGLGTDTAVDGTLDLSGSKGAGGVVTGTLSTNNGPLTLTAGGLSFQSTVQLSDTYDPTTRKGTLSGSMSTRDPLGDTATTAYATDGSSTTTISDTSNKKLVSEATSSNGVITVAVYNGGGTALLTKTYPSLDNVNINDFQ